MLGTYTYTLFNGGDSTYPSFEHYKTTAPESMETPETIEQIIGKVRELYPKAHSFGLDLEDHEEADHHHDNLSVYVKGGHLLITIPIY